MSEPIQFTARADRPLLSIVTPAFNEQENLPSLYARLHEVLTAGGVDWEWIVVDDHSSDATFATLVDLNRSDARVRAIRFARNFGSHAAITCGMAEAAGDCCVVLAADLQDPPEVISSLLAEWKSGAQIVWAVRRERPGEAASTVAFSRLYYFLMRHFVKLEGTPPTGADFFLLDRKVLEALQLFTESNVSIFALLTWMGFRQSYVPYDKAARQHGRSSWTLSKKLKLVADSITAFSFAPIRLMSWIGFAVALLGFGYAAFIVAYHFLGYLVPGWSSLMVAILVIGGLQMGMLGVLGEYLWRALEESRRRPRYFFEAQVGAPARREQTSAASKAL